MRLKYILQFINDIVYKLEEKGWELNILEFIIGSVSRLEETG